MMLAGITSASALLRSCQVSNLPYSILKPVHYADILDKPTELEMAAFNEAWPAGALELGNVRIA